MEADMKKRAEAQNPVSRKKEKIKQITRILSLFACDRYIDELNRLLRMRFNQGNHISTRSKNPEIVMRIFCIQQP